MLPEVVSTRVRSQPGVRGLWGPVREAVGGGHHGAVISSDGQSGAGHTRAVSPVCPVFLLSTFLLLALQCWKARPVSAPWGVFWEEVRAQGIRPHVP